MISQIADLNMTVIATDGFSIEPIVVERITSLSGERYDVVLSAKNDSNLSKVTHIQYFWCFFHPNSTLFPDETLITVRGLGLCKLYNYKTQEFARIIFVNDLKEHKRKFDDYRPLKNRPIYEAQDVLKLVGFIMADRRNDKETLEVINRN